MTPLPAGHLHVATDIFRPCKKPGAEPGHATSARALLDLASRNSTCFFATGSYFFFTSLSVMVREFLRVT